MLKKFLCAVLLFTNLSLFADTSQIETLERQRWEYMKTQNWKALDNIVAPYFQMAFFDGVRNKDQFMRQLRSVNISEYKLSDFIITEGPDVAVVTYDISVSETIEGKRITSNANRLSVWQNDHGKWQIIAHALLIPVSSSKN